MAQLVTQAQWAAIQQLSRWTSREQWKANVDKILHPPPAGKTTNTVINLGNDTIVVNTPPNDGGGGYNSFNAGQNGSPGSSPNDTMTRGDEWYKQPFIIIGAIVLVGAIVLFKRNL